MRHLGRSEILILVCVILGFLFIIKVGHGRSVMATSNTNLTKHTKPERAMSYPSNTNIHSLLTKLEAGALSELQALLKESPHTAQDDPRFSPIIRKLLHQPADGLVKRSLDLRATPQAEAIIELLGEKTSGFFVECGALDGERASNTLYLELQQGWTGLLVEMDPLFFLQLLGKNRASYALHACLSPDNNTRQMEFKASDGGLGKLQVGGQSHVNCFPLYSIMLAMNQKVIDYFSLDVEGQELNILKTIPFDKLDIRTLSVEYNHLPKGDKAEMVKFMEAHGYTMYKDIKFKNPTLKWYVNDFIFLKTGFSLSHSQED